MLLIRPVRSGPPQAAAASQPRLDARHLARVALVIVAEQVQQAVQREHREFGGERVPRLARLTRGDAAGDHDVAEVARHSPASRGESPLPVRSVTGNDSTSVA